MCKDATIIPRVKPSEDQSKILCNVIVRATHELHVNQGKNEDEVETFLKNDCQQLPTANLQQKVKSFHSSIIDIPFVDLVWRIRGTIWP